MRYSTTFSVASAAALTLLSTLLTVQSPTIALAAATVRDADDLLYMREADVSRDKVVFATGEDNGEDEIESDLWWQEVTGERLEKRRGGGGRGGGGGSSSGRSGGGRTGGGSSGSSSSFSGMGSSSSRSSSNVGGRTSAGSGTPRGSGGSYSGGAGVPYTASRRSPSGIAPFLLPLGALAFFPGLWLFSVYAYPFTQPISYHNNTNNQNQTLPVLCLCQQYGECGCDENHNQTYTQELVDNATRFDNDSQPYVSKIADVNGTRTLIINGTLANGTTAPGGTDSAAAALRETVLGNFGLTVLVAAVGWCTYML